MGNNKESIRRYIIEDGFMLRGFKLLPFALQHRYAPFTEFFVEYQYKLLMDCDGKTDIDWDNLSDKQREYYDEWEKKRFIRRAEEGDELKPYQEYKYYDARFKQMVQWSITGRCNYKCKHCFMSAPHAEQGEPTWDELMTMLDSFERCGIRNLHITGGEPLVRSDFMELVDEILSRGLVIDIIYSNGLLVTDEFLDELEARGVWCGFQFSFDGVGHHDWMRGVKGAEKIALDAIKRCVDRGRRVSVSTVLCKESVGCIRKTVNLLASLGVRHIKIGAANPLGEWANEPEHFLTREELYEAFLEYIPQFYEDGCRVSIGLEGFFSYDTLEEKAFSIQEKHIEEKYFDRAQMCSHVRREMYVSPQGNVLPCMSMVGGPIESQFPNMLETSLDEILDKESLYMDIIGFTVKDYMEHNPDCAVCEYREECCGGCRAIAVRDHPTDYLAKDLDTCEYYKGGWKEKKDQLLDKLKVARI